MGQDRRGARTPSSPWRTPCAICASATRPPSIFDSGLGISIFRDNSTRTRFSFASACNLLGLEVQDLDEKKSQIAHGETVRETANMVSFMADVIGIRDDMFIGEGHKYQKTFMDAAEGGLPATVFSSSSPTLVNLQCDVDHPTQCMADMLHIIHEFGGVENLKGKKIAMTWAYSPSYGKPLVRAAGRHRPDDPLRHGRRARPSRGL